MLQFLKNGKLIIVMQSMVILMLVMTLIASSNTDLLKRTGYTGANPIKFDSVYSQLARWNSANQSDTATISDVLLQNEEVVEEVKPASVEAPTSLRKPPPCDNTQQSPSSTPPPTYNELVPEGFAQEPLTIEKLRLCDQTTNIVLKGTMQCEGDPSCKKCTERHVKNADKLKKEFLPKLHAYDMADFLTSTKRVVVMAVNFGQVHYLLNWYIAVLKNTELHPCDFTFVVATDKEAYDTIKNRTCLHTMFPELEYHISARYIGANVGPHAAINNILFMTVEYFVSKSKIVLLSDVDVVWFADVFPELERRSQGIDSVCMVSAYTWDARSICNTGFVYINPTAKSKILWKTLCEAFRVKVNSDQMLYNSVLRHQQFGQYFYQVLPQNLFCLSGQTTKHFSKEVTIAYHALSSQKEEKFKRVKGWYYETHQHLLKQGNK